jgi:hypothetical protein
MAGHQGLFDHGKYLHSHTIAVTNCNPLQREDIRSCGDVVQHIALRRLLVHSAIGLGIAYILSFVTEQQQTQSQHQCSFENRRPECTCQCKPLQELHPSN